MRIIQLAVACVAVLVATMGHVQAGFIFSTGMQTNPQNTGGFSNGSSWQVYDNFSIASSDDLRSVRNWQIGVTSGSASNLGSFTFKVFLGDAFTVASLTEIYSQTLSTADYTATIDPLLTGNTFPEIGTFFQVSFDLASALSLSGATNYAVSMFGTDEEFRWANIGVGDGFNQVANLSIDNLRLGNTPITFDNEFLATNTVPEPSSLAIFGIGACIAGIGAARRRRREEQQETTA